MELLTINCIPMSARLTEYGCKQNQDIAERAYNKLFSLTVSRLTPQEIHRLFHCGSCNLCTKAINMDKVKEQCKSEFLNLHKEIMDYLENNPIMNFELPEDTYNIILPEDEGEE